MPNKQVYLVVEIRHTEIRNETSAISTKSDKNSMKIEEEEEEKKIKTLVMCLSFVSFFCTHSLLPQTLC